MGIDGTTARKTGDDTRSCNRLSFHPGTPIPVKTRNLSLFQPRKILTPDINTVGDLLCRAYKPFRTPLQKKNGRVSEFCTAEMDNFFRSQQTCSSMSNFGSTRTDTVPNLEQANIATGTADVPQKGQRK